LYEGFGLPVLEAMQLGCPVIAVNRTSVSEVGGDAALYEDPDVPGELAEAMETMLKDSEARESWIQAGYRQSSLFSWEKTARQTADFYQSLV
jgi:glycosyltransferase involved in cell wall biosynthesis